MNIYSENFLQNQNGGLDNNVRRGSGEFYFPTNFAGSRSNSFSNYLSSASHHPSFDNLNKNTLNTSINNIPSKDSENNISSFFSNSYHLLLKDKPSVFDYSIQSKVLALASSGYLSLYFDDNIEIPRKLFQYDQAKDFNLIRLQCAANNNTYFSSFFNTNITTSPFPTSSSVSSSSIGLIATTQGSNLFVWDTADEIQLKSYIHLKGGQVFDLKWCPSQLNSFASSSAYAGLTFYDVRCLTRPTHHLGLHTSSASSSFSFTNVASSSSSSSTNRLSYNSVTQLEWHPTQPYLIGGILDSNYLILWDIRMMSSIESDQCYLVKEFPDGISSFAWDCAITSSFGNESSPYTKDESFNTVATPPQIDNHTSVSSPSSSFNSNTNITTSPSNYYIWAASTRSNELQYWSINSSFNLENNFKLLNSITHPSIETSRKIFPMPLRNGLIILYNKENNEELNEQNNNIKRNESRIERKKLIKKKYFFHFFDLTKKIKSFDLFENEFLDLLGCFWRINSLSSIMNNDDNLQQNSSSSNENYEKYNDIFLFTFSIFLNDGRIYTIDIPYNKKNSNNLVHESSFSSNSTTIPSTISSTSSKKSKYSLSSLKSIRNTEINYNLLDLRKFLELTINNLVSGSQYSNYSLPPQLSLPSCRSVVGPYTFLDLLQKDIALLTNLKNYFGFKIVAIDHLFRTITFEFLLPPSHNAQSSYHYNSSFYHSNKLRNRASMSSVTSTAPLTFSDHFNNSYFSQEDFNYFHNNKLINYKSIRLKISFSLRISNFWKFKASIEKINEKSINDILDLTYLTKKLNFDSDKIINAKLFSLSNLYSHQYTNNNQDNEFDTQSFSSTCPNNQQNKINFWNMSLYLKNKNISPNENTDDIDDLLLKQNDVLYNTLENENIRLTIDDYYAELPLYNLVRCFASRIIKSWEKKSAKESNPIEDNNNLSSSSLDQLFMTNGYNEKLILPNVSLKDILTRNDSNASNSIISNLSKDQIFIQLLNPNEKVNEDLLDDKKSLVSSTVSTSTITSSKSIKVSSTPYPQTTIKSTQRYLFRKSFRTPFPVLSGGIINSKGHLILFGKAKLDIKDHPVELKNSTIDKVHPFCNYSPSLLNRIDAHYSYSFLIASNIIDKLYNTTKVNENKSNSPSSSSSSSNPPNSSSIYNENVHSGIENDDLAEIDDEDEDENENNENENIAMRKSCLKKSNNYSNEYKFEPSNKSNNNIDRFLYYNDDQSKNIDLDTSYHENQLLILHYSFHTKQKILAKYYQLDLVISNNPFVSSKTKAITDEEYHSICIKSCYLNNNSITNAQEEYESYLQSLGLSPSNSDNTTNFNIVKEKAINSPTPQKKNPFSLNNSNNTASNQSSISNNNQCNSAFTSTCTLSPYFHPLYQTFSLLSVILEVYTVVDEGSLINWPTSVMGIGLFKRLLNYARDISQIQNWSILISLLGGLNNVIKLCFNTVDINNLFYHNENENSLQDSDNKKDKSIRKNCLNLKCKTNSSLMLYKFFYQQLYSYSKILRMWELDTQSLDIEKLLINKSSFFNYLESLTLSHFNRNENADKEISLFKMDKCYCLYYERKNALRQKLVDINNINNSSQLSISIDDENEIIDGQITPTNASSTKKKKGKRNKNRYKNRRKKKNQTIINTEDEVNKDSNQLDNKDIKDNKDYSSDSISDSYPDSDIDVKNNSLVKKGLNTVNPPNDDQFNYGDILNKEDEEWGLNVICVNCGCTAETGINMVNSNTTYDYICKSSFCQLSDETNSSNNNLNFDMSLFNNTTVKPAIRCCLCLLPVRGIMSFCAKCGHGGHMKHMKDWFEIGNEACPSGCGCHCADHNFEGIGDNLNMIDDGNEDFVNPHDQIQFGHDPLQYDEPLTFQSNLNLSPTYDNDISKSNFYIQGKVSSLSQEIQRNQSFYSKNSQNPSTNNTVYSNAMFNTPYSGFNKSQSNNNPLSPFISSSPSISHISMSTSPGVGISGLLIGSYGSNSNVDNNSNNNSNKNSNKK